MEGLWCKTLFFNLLNKKKGMLLREISLIFFGGSFARTYLMTSKIKREYMDVYVDCIHKFYKGA